MLEESELIKKAWKELKDTVADKGEFIKHCYDINKELSKGSLAVCPVCGSLFTKNRKNHIFCCPDCRKGYNRYFK